LLRAAPVEYCEVCLPSGAFPAKGDVPKVATQVVLGIFAGIFTYCLIVLRTIRGGDESDLRAAYSIDRNRTVYQDCAFGIRQLVDMALRALSPGINDTTTAVMCVDYLTAILTRLASRKIPSSRRYEDGELRVISIGQTFATLVPESFDQIRGGAEGNLAIMLRMLDALQTIASLTGSPNRRRVLREQVEGMAELAGRTIESLRDQARFESRLARVREALETKPSDQRPTNPSKHED
jgi:uncharacterized membrane protein